MKYDVFLSHNSQDKAYVEQIARCLEQHELVVFFDKWHLVPGEPWQEALEEALSTSSSCAVFLGSSGLGPWENEEVRTALDMRVRVRSIRIIPVLLPGANPLDQNALPAFLRRITWVDLRTGLNNTEGLQSLIAGIRGVPPLTQTTDTGAFDLKSGIVHALPPAPYFTGRKRHLNKIKTFWNTGTAGVICLIGIGGAGKTALVAEFINAIVGAHSLGYEPGELRAPDGCFVWSFYVDQNVESFLSQAFQYFSGGKQIDARSSGAIYRLIDLFLKGGRYVIVLDGLERIQRNASDFRHSFGEIEDPLLKQLVRRLAAGSGSSLCIVTSRFPLTDIGVWVTRSGCTIDVDELEMEDGIELMKLHDFKQPDAVLRDVINRFGSHALTLDHICTYAKHFCNHDLTVLKYLGEPKASSGSRTERKLARILEAYEKALSPQELDLLCRLCIFRFGTDVQTIGKIFEGGKKHISGALRGCTNIELRRSLHRLVKLHLVLQESADHYTTHPAVKDYFYRRFRNAGPLHSAIKNHFANLANRPGIKHPDNKEQLDILEEVVYHAISSGAIDEGFEVYSDKMGGVTHLAYRLGDYARGVRILESFPVCPSRVDMATYLRVLGEPERSLEFLSGEEPEQTIPALILLGRLPQALRIAAQKIKLSQVYQVRLLIKPDLCKIDARLFHNRLDCLAHPHLAYHIGEKMRPVLVMIRDGLTCEGHSVTYAIGNDIDGNTEQKIRCDFSLAEVHRQAGDTGACKSTIDSLTQWIMLSGSQELLCLLHLTRGRLSLSRQDYVGARVALMEARYLAKNCQFSLYFIDASNELAGLAIERGEYGEAIDFLHSALYGLPRTSDKPATDPDLPLSRLSILGAEHRSCQYGWGAAQAREMLRRVSQE